MTQLSRNTNTKPKRTLFHSNPVLSRLSKAEARTGDGTATYSGIASKTCYFLMLTLAGMFIQLLVKAALASAPVWKSFEIYEKFTVSLSRTEAIVLIAVLIAGVIAELVGIFVRKTIPVTGTIYAASQGYVISFLVFNVLKGFEYLGLEALVLTVAVVAVMSWLYSSGRVRGGKKYRTVLLTLFIGSILVSVLLFVGSLIPATRPYVQTMVQNSAFVIAMDIIGIVIAALFLISDFSVIDTCVTDGYPKDYEWSAAFGLVFTVIWLYLKILDLLMQLSSTSKD